MNNVLFKDIFREIKKSISKFVAILSIIAISVAFFVGVRMTAPDMKITANKYFKDTNFMDFYILSNFGFNSKDIEELKKIDSVSAVMPVYSIDAVINMNDEGTVTRIHSLPNIALDENSKDYLNRPTVVLGRLPEAQGECVVESGEFFEKSFKIGDRVKLTSGNDTNILDSLVTDEYTIVGTITSPLYVTNDRGTTNIGAGKILSYMAINEKDFKIDTYTGVYIKSNVSDIYEAFSTGYNSKINEVEKSIEFAADKREIERYNEIKEEASKLLQEKEDEYNSKVVEQEKLVNDARSQIESSQKQVDIGWYKLTEAKKEFNNSINSAKVQIDQAESQIETTKAEYNKMLNDFNTQVSIAKESGVYETQKPIFDATEAQLNAMKSGIDSGISELNTKKSNLEDEIKKANDEFSKTEKELTSGQVKINQSKIDLEKGVVEANTKFSEAKIEIEKAKVDIESIDKVTWHIFDRDDNLGYNEYGSSSDRVAAIAEVFPIIFIFVAILICVTSMERMVEEHRMLIGTAKSLGYSNFSIMFKYLAYSSLASTIGAIIGLVIGFGMFPKFLADAFPYVVPELILQVNGAFALIALVSSIAITSFSVIIACQGSLKQNVAELMRPKAPKPGKKVLLEKLTFIWKRLKFTQKVTVRNIFRYKSRFFMTVIGIAGCTSLILVGFGLNDAISEVGNKQFTELFKYNISINLKDNITKENLDNIMESIKKLDENTQSAILFSKSVDITGKSEKSCTLIVPEDISSFNNIVIFRDRISQNNINLNDDGIILTEKMAKMLDVKTGETIKLKLTDENTYELKVSAIIENYLSHYMYMSKELYEKIYSDTAKYNQIYTKINNFQMDKKEYISKNIMESEGVSVVIFSDDILDNFDEMINSVKYVVIILILSAGLLSLIVIYTLTNINISERTREIATIKVLGFYENEVSKYVYRENIILTIIGSLIGLIIGYYLSNFVVITSEIDILMFDRQIHLMSFIYSVVITIIFTLIVNSIMLKNLKNINMVEALKTIE